MTPAQTPGSGTPAFARDGLMPDDADGFALGCECADPCLQIERWSQETAGPRGDAY
jgi:hypothetical protein